MEEWRGGGVGGGVERKSWWRRGEELVEERRGVDGGVERRSWWRSGEGRSLECPHLSPVSGAPLGASASSPSAAPPPAGFGPPAPAELLREEAARGARTAHRTGLEPSAAGGGALRDARRRGGRNI